MAAINFYRFASAIMELLEPKVPLQDSSEKLISSSVVTTNEIASLVLADKTKNLALQAEVIATTAPISIEAEAKTVETVAANLSQLLAHASDEKLAQVAEVIKQVATETAPSVAEQQTVLSQTIDQAKTVSSADEAAQVVQATVSALAAKTVEDIKESKIELPAIIGAKTTEVVTDVLTEKIQQKTAEAGETSSTNKIETVESINVEPEDFWLKYDEIDPSKIKYYGTMSYLYEYMNDRSLFNCLDPNNDLTERLTSIGKVMDSASQNYSWESEVNRNVQQSSISQNDHLKETKQDLREQNARKLQQLQLQQRLEREKMAERIASERLKEAM